MIWLLVFCVILKSATSTYIDIDWDVKRPVFNPKVYENALDPEACQEQLSHIRSNSRLRLRFLDSGLRIPRGIVQLNFMDLGDYDQCLEINEDIDTSVIEGKYCLIQVPGQVAQRMNWQELDESLLSDENIKKHNQIEDSESKIKSFLTGVDQSRTSIGDSNIAIQMALCVPKVCTPNEGLSGLLLNFTRLGFRYDELYCRFKDDKPWVPADYVAISIFSIIGVLTILSTSYDIYYNFFTNDPKQASNLYKIFSIYTNGRRLTTFTDNPNSINCIDGIRAISMFWIVAGHTYLLLPPMINRYYAFAEWLFSLKSLWITGAPFTVDTFFFLAGLLLVYTSIGKMSGNKLLKNLHLFYLNRLLRMFPLLATLVLLQTSLLFRIADGPMWGTMRIITDSCRMNWWATLLYVQNYVNVNRQCILHSWYLAIDIQCYLISPIVLYWVLSKKKNHAWIGLAFGVLASLTAVTTYSFIMKFPGWILAPAHREDGSTEYQTKFYFNTITRAPPFFIGMVFGYIINKWKGRKPEINLFLNFFLWIVSGGTMMGLIYTTHEMKQPGWRYGLVDDLFNSFSKSIWSLALGWMIFSCQTGYGGPINWFLCLDIWKLPSRISYAIYLFHYHIQFVIQGMARQTIFFSDALAMYYFFSQVLISYGVAFTMTLLIDSPFSSLVKLALGGGTKKPARDK